jgi:hypothetical protein
VNVVRPAEDAQFQALTAALPCRKDSLSAATRRWLARVSLPLIKAASADRPIRHATDDRSADQAWRAERRLARWLEPGATPATPYTYSGAPRRGCARNCRRQRGLAD